MDAEEAHNLILKACESHHKLYGVRPRRIAVNMRVAEALLNRIQAIPHVIETNKITLVYMDFPVAVVDMFSVPTVITFKPEDHE